MTSSFAFQASTQILPQNRIGQFLFESTLEPGFRKVCFQAPDPPGPSKRSAQTDKTYVVSPSEWNNNAFRERPMQSQ